jgi:hypothetical protein
MSTVLKNILPVNRLLELERASFARLSPGQGADSSFGPDALIRMSSLISSVLGKFPSVLPAMAAFSNEELATKWRLIDVNLRENDTPELPPANILLRFSRSDKEWLLLLGEVRYLVLRGAWFSDFDLEDLTTRLVWQALLASEIDRRSVTGR